MTAGELQRLRLHGGNLYIDLFDLLLDGFHDGGRDRVRLLPGMELILQLSAQLGQRRAGARLRAGGDQPGVPVAGRRRRLLAALRQPVS